MGIGFENGRPTCSTQDSGDLDEFDGDLAGIHVGLVLQEIARVNMRHSKDGMRYC